ncbi:MAG: RNA-binding domain-containing protein [Rhizobiaceae bacterium]
MALADPVELLNTLRAHDGETEWFEFKKNSFKPEDFGEYISALANSAMLNDKRHAFLVYGVDNKTKEIVGTNINLKNETKGGEVFENWLSRMLSPKINFSFETTYIAGKKLEIVSIEPAYDRPVKFINVAYIRVGENKRHLDEFPEKERALWALTSRQSFELGIAESHLDQDEISEMFHFQKISEIYYPHVKQLPAAIEQMLADGLLYDDLQGGYDITNLMAILAAKNINDHKTIENKSPRVIVYKGRNKVEAEDDVTGQTGYAIAFPLLLKYITGKIMGKEIFVHGVRKRETYYPEVAVREFIANAIIHQDLLEMGVRPTIEIYSDKIKIINAGKPFVEPERIIDAPPRSRNERLASFMRRAGHCEERGSGIVRALQAIERAGQSPPLFQVVNNSYVVTMFKTTEFGSMSRDDRIRACYQHSVLRHLDTNPMNNSSLRARMNLKDSQSSQVSNVIKDALEAGLIKPLEPNQGYRIAKYLPYWA